LRNPGISLQTKLCCPPCGAYSEVLGDFQSFRALLSPYLAQSALCQIPPWVLHIPQKVGMPFVRRPFRGDEAEELWRAPPNPPARTGVAMVSTPPLVPLLEGRRRRIALRLAAVAPRKAILVRLLVLGPGTVIVTTSSKRLPYFFKCIEYSSSDTIFFAVFWHHCDGERKCININIYIIFMHTSFRLPSIRIPRYQQVSGYAYPGTVS